MKPAAALSSCPLRRPQDGHINDTGYPLPSAFFQVREQSAAFGSSETRERAYNKAIRVVMAGSYDSAFGPGHAYQPDQTKLENSFFSPMFALRTPKMTELKQRRKTVRKRKASMVEIAPPWVDPTCSSHEMSKTELLITPVTTARTARFRPRLDRSAAKVELPAAGTATPTDNLFVKSAYAEGSCNLSPRSICLNGASSSPLASPWLNQNKLLDPTKNGAVCPAPIAMGYSATPAYRAAPIHAVPASCPTTHAPVRAVPALAVPTRAAPTRPSAIYANSACSTSTQTDLKYTQVMPNRPVQP
mmetsp:Transcript_30480/g.50489  ORF Transcript_30480/g.50489 Transcript_30480/m.50489 type:complete len:302 (+) Transcript_30480:66-971(+)|eukprot:CAMPEP_0119319316 /NCGR_PEP_ID=MMETSP1333-20130426/49077_1 /TAXON_ID=418940 /ORGANISM="Scyphosphaera apsteinii, Strain RCC1455" /LENGTH=301 /DNA_ID=CAMNT_0007325693 /DNA_START=64 /DNA_END=969 /DNA_ORIENTATION=-